MSILTKQVDDMIHERIELIERVVELTAERDELRVDAIGLAEVRDRLRMRLAGEMERTAAVTAERDELLADKAKCLQSAVFGDMTDEQSQWFNRGYDCSLTTLTNLESERNALRDENNAFKSHLGTSFTKLVMKKIKEKKL